LEEKVHHRWDLAVVGIFLPLQGCREGKGGGRGTERGSVTGRDFDGKTRGGGGKEKGGWAHKRGQICVEATWREVSRVEIKKTQSTSIWGFPRRKGWYKKGSKGWGGRIGVGPTPGMGNRESYGPYPQKKKTDWGGGGGGSRLSNSRF